jgi:hypothetical protein
MQEGCEDCVQENKEKNIQLFDLRTLGAGVQQFSPLRGSEKSAGRCFLASDKDESEHAAILRSGIQQKKTGQPLSYPVLKSSP